MSKRRYSRIFALAENAVIARLCSLRRDGPDLGTCRRKPKTKQLSDSGGSAGHPALKAK